MIVLIISFLIAGLSNGLMDAIAFHGAFKDDPFWGLDAWRNSYKNGDPSQGPGFLGSASFLAFLCSGWHLLKMIRIESINIGLVWVLARSWWQAIIIYALIRISFHIGFWITYEKKIIS